MIDKPKRRSSPKGEDTLAGMDAIRERLKAMEFKMEQTDGRLAKIEKIVTGNGGDSLPDRVECILWLLDGNDRLGIRGVRANLADNTKLLDRFVDRDKKMRYVLIGLGLGVGVQALGILGIIIKLSELFTIIP